MSRVACHSSTLCALCTYRVLWLEDAQEQPHTNNNIKYINQTMDRITISYVAGWEAMTPPLAHQQLLAIHVSHGNQTIHNNIQLKID